MPFAEAVPDWPEMERASERDVSRILAISNRETCDIRHCSEGVCEQQLEPRVTATDTV